MAKERYLKLKATSTFEKMKDKSFKVTTYCPQETFALGVEVGKALGPGAFIALEGGLGAGKTLFTKGVAKGLGVKEYEYVNSPTFTILRVYKGKIPLYHFDVYRLEGSEGLNTVGYEDYFYGHGVCVVEWADKIKDILPMSRIEIKIEHSKKNTRKILIVQK